MSISIKNVTRTAAVAAFVGLAVAGGTGLAGATTSQDDLFISVLDDQGIGYDSAYHAVSAANYVCNSFDSGSSFTEVAYDVLDQSTLSEYNTGYFIGAAVYTYCPEYTYLLPS